MDRAAPRLVVLTLALAAMSSWLHTGARLPLGADAGTMDALGAVDPLHRYLQLLLLAGAAAVCAANARRCGRVLLSLWPFLPILALAALSALWSESPGATLRRVVTLGTLLLFLLAALGTLGARRLVGALLVGVAVLAAAGVLVAVAQPSVGLDTGDYSHALRGLTLQKNVFGASMLFGMLLLSFRVLDRGRVTLREALAAVALLALIVLAQATATLLLALGVAGVSVLGLMALRGGAAALAAAVAALVAGALTLVALVVGTDTLLELIGKNPTLTGRLPLWEFLEKAAARRPVLGYGYSAFWLADARWVQLARETLDWDIPNAHNGVLELRLQLGWVGVAAALLAFLATAGLAFFHILLGRRAMALWMFLVLGTVAMLARTESVLLNPDWVTLVVMLGFAVLRWGPGPAGDAVPGEAAAFSPAPTPFEWRGAPARPR